MAQSGEPENVVSESVAREKKILTFWRDNSIFEKSLAKDSPRGDFVFYEGPPTANGRPGVHHIESRSFKDALPRYKTMRGFRVPRRAGWDTHGLPVELEVEKELGFTGKKDIEEYGVAAFNKKCRESVMRYIGEWQKFTDRIAYWVDQDKAYFTFDAAYMESVWSIVKKVSNDDRLYKDYKVLPWCPVCGTALSSHELAQGYEDVKDLSLTVKFQVEPGQKISESIVANEKTYLLAWTTTPWTLPGNVALAVGTRKVPSKILYLAWEEDGQTFIASADFFNKLNPSRNQNVVLLDAEDLVGLKYKPLYPFAHSLATEGERVKFEKAFQVYSADFVTSEDGTGIVHTAVMYGQEDFDLGQKIGLPKVHLVAPDGKFVAGTGFLEGASVIDPETNVAVLKDLQAKGLFFSKENYTHSYPHCWRSKNRLIYYARDSWYIRMHDLRDTLLSENDKVNWEPAHIRDGRMGEWLKNVKDWAISRERYWGTPLPVWQSADGAERLVIGSIDELKAHTKKSGNRYFAIRHAQAENNVLDELDATDEKKWPLTETGRAQAVAAGKKLKGEGIDVIYASPLARSQETARIVAGEIGLAQDSILIEDRIKEVNVGELNGRPLSDFFDYRRTHSYGDAFPGGESHLDAKRRFGAFLYELEAKHTNKTILIVTHGIGLEMLVPIASGADAMTTHSLVEADMPRNTETRELSFVPLPHNEDYELDLHKPYIDEVTLVSDSGAELKRTSEVMDVWFDSGAMPFAQEHYPFAKRAPAFPADFISEAIDQTRGWFYTLLAIGVLMGKGTPYRNVICLGHLLDEKGQKMSKSKGNIIVPADAIAEFGVDTLRFWMYHVNRPGDSKNFDEKTVKEAARVISWLDNSAKFYALFAGNREKAGKPTILDTWMVVRTNAAVQEVTKAMDAYDLYTASRTTASLIEDLSQWYVRRVRDRVRDGDGAALSTLRHTLRTCALLLAPLAPFIAEEVFQTVRDASDPESVHLASWPEVRVSFIDGFTGKVKQDEQLIADMARVRSDASEALKLRQQSGIKVSQVLGSFSTTSVFTDADDLLTLLAEEINVKEVIPGAAETTLNTVLTPELIAEGDERAFQRAVSEARKTEGFSPKDTVHVERREDGAHVAELSAGPVRFSLTRDAS